MWGMTPVLEPKKPSSKRVAVAYRGPADLVGELDRAAKEKGISRNEAMTQLLRYALDAHWKDSKRTRK